MKEKHWLIKGRVQGVVGPLIALIGALVVACASPDVDDHTPEVAGEHAVVMLPSTSQLTYDATPENPGVFHFEGEIAVTGILLAYWEASYTETEPVTLADAEPARTLALRFYPDSESIRHLPRFEMPGTATQETDRIFLYRDVERRAGLDRFITEYSPGEREAIREIMRGFEDIPASFLEHEEGYTLQPVRVVLSDMISFIEGNARLTFANPSHLKQISFSDYVLAHIPDAQEDTFLGRPWVESFFVTRDTMLRAQPSDDADTIARIASGTVGIEKIHTVDESWVRVRVPADQAQRREGYVRTSELMVVN